MEPVVYEKYLFKAFDKDFDSFIVHVKVPRGTPLEYVWMLALRECDCFPSDLRELHMLEQRKEWVYNETYSRSDTKF